MIEQFYFIHSLDPNRLNQSGQSGPGSKGNEEVLHIPQRSKNGAPPSDAVKCNTLDTLCCRCNLHTQMRGQSTEISRPVHVPR